MEDAPKKLNPLEILAMRKKQNLEVIQEAQASDQERQEQEERAKKEKAERLSTCTC